jgi:glycosyltransferase involved in cell wall biosynthesis
MTQSVCKQAPLRVALITECLKLGGSTTFLCNFAGELISRNIATEVLSFERENPLRKDFERLQVPVITQNERKVIFEDRLLRTLQHLREFQPTVVVGCLSATSFEVLRYVPRGVFRIAMVQSDDPGMYQMVRFYGGDLDLMAAVSKTIKDTLANMPEFASVRVAYLPYGVPMPATAPARNFNGENPLRILYLGRLEQEQKRVRFFPHMLGQLRASKIPFHWTIAGEGSEKPFLESVMKSTPGQTVSFPGKVLYGAVPDLLSSHDVFLLASDYEGLPLSLIEALSYGMVPVVSDLRSGVRDLVDNSNGRRVDPADPEGYGRAILWLNEHRAEMTSMAQNCAEKVRSEFSVKAMTDRWLSELPSEPPKAEAWPQTWNIKPPLPARKALRFSPLGRGLRSLAFKFRKG